MLLGSSTYDNLLYFINYKPHSAFPHSVEAQRNHKKSMRTQHNSWHIIVNIKVVAELECPNDEQNNALPADRL